MATTTNIQPERSSAARSAEVAAVAAHLAMLDGHLAAIGKPAEAVVARRLAERLRAAIPARRRLPS